MCGAFCSIFLDALKSHFIFSNDYLAAVKVSDIFFYKSNYSNFMDTNAIAKYKHKYEYKVIYDKKALF